MAIRQDASGEYLSRTGLSMTAYTIMGWFKITTDRNDYSVFINLKNLSNEPGLETAADGTTLMLWNGTSETTGSALTVGTAYHLAFVINGTSATAYLNGVSNITATIPGTALTELWIGTSSFGEFLNGTYDCLKVYSTNLTAAEIQNEMWSRLPKRTANLVILNPRPISTDLADYSGNGNTWTANGTLSSEDGPGISWGAPFDMSIYEVASGGGSPDGPAMGFRSLLGVGR